MRDGGQSMYSKHFCGLWLGGRQAADNHAGLMRNQINCLISCLPDESKLTLAPTTASGQKDFLDLGKFDFNYWVGNVGPNTRFSKETLMSVKQWVKMIDERLQLGYDVLVACRQGALRSFVLVGCYLMVTKKENAAQIHTTKNKDNNKQYNKAH